MTAATSADVSRPAPGERATLWFLMLGNVVIGAGVLAPAAMINALTAGLSVGPPAIGALIGWGALVLGIGAPTLALATGRTPRRTLLAACLAVYAFGHVLSALAPDYTSLIVTRLVMISAAAVYTPQAASTVALIVPAERRSASVAFVFMGWPLATAVASPALSIIGETWGWRAGFWLLAGASALALIGVLARTPRALTPPVMSLKSWGEVLTRPAILTLLGGTTVLIGAQFSLFAYLAAELKRAASASAGEVALGLTVYGGAALIGSIITGQMVKRFSASATQICCQICVASGIGIWALFSHSLPMAILAVGVWGLGFGGGVSMQQARLITVSPALAPASVALNTSVLYIGQACGATLGGALIARGLNDMIGYVAVGMMVVAISLSYTARRVFRA
jgi:DHA1 family inner membrane transport protein